MRTESNGWVSRTRPAADCPQQSGDLTGDDGDHDGQLLASAERAITAAQSDLCLTIFRSGVLVAPGTAQIVEQGGELGSKADRLIVIHTRQDQLHHQHDQVVSVGRWRHWMRGVGSRVIVAPDLPEG